MLPGLGEWVWVSKLAKARHHIDILPKLDVDVENFSSSCIKITTKNKMFLLAVFSCCCKQTVRKTHLKCIKFELMNWQKSGEAVEAIEAMEQSTASCCQRQEGGGLRWLMARTCRMWASGAQSYWLMRGCQLRRNEGRTGANLWIIQKSISNGPQTKDEQESHTLRRQKSKAKLELEMEMEDTGDVQTMAKNGKQLNRTWQLHGSPTRSS